MKICISNRLLRPILMNLKLFNILANINLLVIIIHLPYPYFWNTEFDSMYYLKLLIFLSYLVNYTACGYKNKLRVLG